MLLESWPSSLDGWLLHHSSPLLKLRRNAKQTLSFRFRATIKIKVATTPIVWITDNSIPVYFLVFMVLVSNHNVTHLGPQAFHLLPPVTWIGLIFHGFQKSHLYLLPPPQSALAHLPVEPSVVYKRLSCQVTMK
jgi:hypothetical protein